LILFIKFKILKIGGFFIKFHKKWEKNVIHEMRALAHPHRGRGEGCIPISHENGLFAKRNGRGKYLGFKPNAASVRRF